jgi:hypothetical protein
MDLSRPKRMARPRAAARRIAQASVERRRDERVLGVDMMGVSVGESAVHTKKRVAAAMSFLEQGYGAGGTSYNNSV